MHKNIYLVLFLLYSGKVLSQSREFFTSSYTFVPSSSNDVGFSQLNAQINFPIDQKKGLFSSLRVDQYDFRYSSSLTPYTGSIEQFYNINYTLNHIRDLSKTWKLGARINLGAQSNFKASLSEEDFNIGGGVYVIKLIKKENGFARWLLGLNYTNRLGKPQLIPTIQYSKRYTDGTSFAVGFPNTYYQIRLGAKNSLKALAEIQGFYMNIADQPAFNEHTDMGKANYLSATAGVEFSRKVDENWTVTFKSSYSFVNEYRLMDTHDNEIHDFDLSPMLYISTGVKYNFKKKRKQIRNEK